MNVLAIDPGKTNMGVWYGRVVEVDGKLVPETIFLEKLDMGDVPLYQGAIDTLGAQSFLTDPMVAVVESQDPKNMPARVVACTAYGYLRGRGIDCEFSSSMLKNDAMALLAEQYGIRMLTKPTKEEVPDAKARRRLMHTVNKKNSKTIVLNLLDQIEQLQLADKIKGTRDPQGRKKADDMTDALLLGIGLWIKKNKTAPKKKRVAKSKTK